MVKRTWFGPALAGAFALAGCDPFAPAEPDAPTAAGSVQAAKRPESVPSLWAKGMVDGNVSQTHALVSTDFQGSSGGVAVSYSAFDACLGRVAKMDVDTARFEWRSTPSGASDSVWGDVDWTLVMADGGRYGGRATWAVSRDDAAEWHLARWIESAGAGNWSDLCGGF